MAAASNPYYLTGIAKIYSGTQKELTAQEAIALEFDIGGDFYLFDNYMLQHELGYMSEDCWTATIANIKCSLEQPYYREAIEGWKFRAEFQELLDGLMAEVVENPPGCWDFEFDYPIVE